MPRLSILLFCLTLLVSVPTLSACSGKHCQAGSGDSDPSVRVKGQTDVSVESGRGVMGN